jgi:hypothetical protein
LPLLSWQNSDFNTGLISEAQEIKQCKKIANLNRVTKPFI